MQSRTCCSPHGGRFGEIEAGHVEADAVRVLVQEIAMRTEDPPCLAAFWIASQQQ